ncbi:protein moonraker [Protopterus annectens]|uniref:protein moonraker n=1 Tax=Protopterus annectens TaxID=7888 RepID=UPI001CFA122D|nr:protein moonraker [Protopterus annectens]
MAIDFQKHQSSSAVKKHETVNSQLYETQLKFNKDVPTLSNNLAARFSNPLPIVIEKLSQSHEKTKVEDDGQSSKSSIQFSVVSEDRLNVAVYLAKRDLKRKQLEEKVRDYVNTFGQTKSKMPSEVAEMPRRKTEKNVQSDIKSNANKALENKQQLKQASKVEVTSSGAKMYVYTPDQIRVGPAFSDSPPTRDLQVKQSPKKQNSKSAQEIGRLRKELSSYIQKIEELAKKEKSEEELDPAEKHRAQIRRQEQAIRSARMLYVLQQQVKDIQDELERLSPYKIKHTKKSRAMSRLAAAHRGAVRALQMFATQLSDQSEQRLPAHYKELGQLIRQLSLCSAKVETDPDAEIPDGIIDILQQVEELDYLMEKKSSPEKLKKGLPQPCSSSPVNRKKSPGRQHSTSPGRGNKPAISKEKVPQEQRKSAASRRVINDVIQHAPGASRMQNKLDEKQHLSHPGQMKDIQQPSDRSAVLKAGLEALLHRDALKRETNQQDEPKTKKGVLLPKRSQGFRQPHDERTLQSHFQQATVASKLKQNQLFTKESSIPWVPPNPTSPPASPKRGPWKKEKDVLKSSLTSAAGRDHTALMKEIVEKERLASAENEAVRLAWLDSETARRMRELNQLCKEEIEDIRKMRLKTGSPSNWAEKAEKAVRDRIQPLLNRAQEISDSWERKAKVKESSLKHRLSVQAEEKTAASADLLGEKLLDDLLEDTAMELWNIEHNQDIHREAVSMQDRPTLETMLQRMQEMERYQEEVRRRLTKIVYSDADFWAEEEKQDRGMASAFKRPESPKAIRISKLDKRSDHEVNIIMQKPLDGEAVSESSEADGKVELADNCLTAKAYQQKEGNTLLSVPSGVLQNIHDYNRRYEQHLKLISHEAVGNFNPWHIAENLAEELMEEALGDVVAELQDVCEEYAEAIFTSEFLQPTE